MDRLLFKLAEEPKRWISVTAPPRPSSRLSPTPSSRWRLTTRCTTCSTGVTSSGCAASSKRRRSPLAPRARILSFDIASRAFGAEYVYDVGPVVIGPNPAGAFATNGLTDLLAVGDRQFIAIERSLAVGAATPGTPVTGNSILLYHVDARNATDIAGIADLTGVAITSATKTLMLDLSSLTNDDGSALALDSIEGLTLGPAVDGKQSLLLVFEMLFTPILMRSWTRDLGVQYP
jgi:hypothetical protein